MSESIFIRVKRIVSANIEDIVDSMEKAGGTSIMREAVRELERVVDDAKSERDEATVRRLQAVRQQKVYAEHLDSMQQRAQFAMDEGREDLAEAALHRKLEFEAQLEKLATIEAETTEQERELEEAVASLEIRKAHMEEELKNFEAARQEAGVGIEAPVSKSNDTKRKVERIEKAYARAMDAVGGTTFRSDHNKTSQIAELDTIMKDREIQERMEALRNAKTAS